MKKVMSVFKIVVGLQTKKKQKGICLAQAQLLSDKLLQFLKSNLSM